MADNTTLNTGSGGDTIASDDIAGIKHQRVKLSVGADGSASDAVPVSAGLDTTGAAVQAVGIVAQFDDVTPSSVTENQFAPVRMSTRRALLVEGVASGTVIPVSDGGGALTVDGTVAVSGTVTVDGSGVTQPISAASLPLPSGAATAANQSTLVTNTTNLNNCIVQDDSPFTPATGYLMMVGGEYDDAAPDSVDEGDAGNFRISANRSLHVQVRDAAGNERGLNIDASGNANVTGTVTANLAAGTNNIGDVDILSIAAGDNNIGNVDIVTVPAPLSTTGGGTEATALRVTLASDSTGVISVDDNGGALTVDNGGTFVVQAGTAAHDAAISGNPVRVAGRALSSDYTAVTAGDTADIITTLTGKVVTAPHALPGQTWSYAAASGGITNTTGVTAKAAGAAGVRNYITRCQVINGHATVSTDVQIRDGASGTVLWRGFAQAAGGGVTAVFDPPLRGTAATLVEVACGTTGSATYFNLQGYTAAE